MFPCTHSTSIFIQQKLIWNVVDSIYLSHTHVLGRWRCSLARAQLLIHFDSRTLYSFQCRQWASARFFFSAPLFHFLLISFNCSHSHCLSHSSHYILFVCWFVRWYFAHILAHVLEHWRAFFTSWYSYIDVKSLIDNCCFCCWNESGGENVSNWKIDFRSFVFRPVKSPGVCMKWI